jgi:hypothetical protein
MTRDISSKLASGSRKAREPNQGGAPARGEQEWSGDLDDAEGDNTVEGDVENDAAAAGAVPEAKLGRTNR